MVDHFDIFNSLSLDFIYFRANNFQQHIFHVSVCNKTFSSLFHCKYSSCWNPFESWDLNLYLLIVCDLSILLPVVDELGFVNLSEAWKRLVSTPQPISFANNYFVSRVEMNSAGLVKCLNLHKQLHFCSTNSTLPSQNRFGHCHYKYC